MDPASAIGLASSILTFIEIGCKVVTGTFETAQTGRAPHTEHIDAVAHDLNNAVARFSTPVSPKASDPEKALGEVSVRCQALLKELLTVLESFKVQAAKPGISWDAFRVGIRRIRKDSKVQELQRSLAEYRSEILVHLVTILSDRQLATQIQLGNYLGEARTDLCGIRDALGDFRTEILDKLEQAQVELRSTIQPSSDNSEPLPEPNVLLDKFSIQFREVKDALNRLEAGHSQKTPETRILEQVYFGTSMFQREETLKPADKSTFKWFVEGVSGRDEDLSAEDDDFSSGEDFGLSSDEDDSGSESKNSENASRKGPSEISHFGALKAEVASHFEKWLRFDSGVFHISGKAGSGKSTLMKLILSTERTHKLLREWAGDKRLLFARFYFWAGGDQLQNSLEGLQRSILFEILIQRPHLVREVFGEAYSIVAQSDWDSPIHSRFFTTASFQKAFERLLRLPADPRYRLCLFIDGLDEYGADASSGSLPETQREDLAQSLFDWASNDHIKILASSRPYPEFSGTFAEDQRVHLHLLTHDDMIEFGYHLFEKHRVFRFPGVKERYQDLVQKVVSASGGVFLWTGLTIQRLLASLARRDSFESLEKQLEATPRDLHVLYERMFSEIDEQDRHEAMKMMLLVSEEWKYLGKYSHPRGINAMAISWLESLEDPEFPANQPFIVYTEDEIEEKRQFADYKVNGYTTGLLEVISHAPKRNDDGSWPSSSYLRHTVQFFHKTAQEYVAASSLAKEVLSSSPSLFSLEFYTRLSLAELHFGSLRDEVQGIDYPMERYLEIFRKYLSIPKPCRSLVEAFRVGLEQQARCSAWSGVCLDIDKGYKILALYQPDKSASFDHWAANEVREAYFTQYLAERVRILPGLAHPQDDLSLLLSAACCEPHRPFCDFPRLDRVKMVLESGADPNHITRFQLSRMRRSMNLSVWQAWCLYYVTAMLDEWRGEKYNQDELSQTLELFLKNGVDSDCYVLMRDDIPPSSETSSESSDGEASEDSEYGSDSETDELAQQRITKELQTDLWLPAGRRRRIDPRWHSSKTAYAISLEDFVRQVEPANYKQVERLFRKNGCTQELSTTKLSEIETELATSKHFEFKSPTVRPVDLNQFFADHECRPLYVYWIRWKDATIPGSLKLRLY